MKNLPAMQETRIWSLVWENLGDGNGNPRQYSCLENSIVRGVWRAAVNRIAKNGHSWLTGCSVISYNLHCIKPRSPALQADSLLSEPPGKVKVAQLCPTLHDLMDYTVLGILQARILEWIAFPFSRRSSQPRDQIQVSCMAGWFFTNWAIRKAPSQQRSPYLIGTDVIKL